MKAKQRTNWLTTVEAGKALGLAPSTVQKLVESGELPGFRIGQNIRVSAAAVQKLVAKGECNAT